MEEEKGSLLTSERRRSSSVFFGKDDTKQPAVAFDYIMKLVIIGDSGVGKSALITRFSDNLFSPDFAPTVGIDFKIRTITIANNIKVKLQVWDTAGQERFRAINTAFYRGAMGIFIVYSVENRDSFKSVCDKWITDTVNNSNFKTCVPNGEPQMLPLVMLVGNKCDSSTKVVTTEEASEFATKNNMMFMEASAKESTNVEELFVLMTKLIFEKVGGVNKPETYVLLKPPTEEKIVEIKKKSFC